MWERNVSVWLPLTCPLLGTWPATQACALTGSRTIDPLVHRLALSPLSHSSQGIIVFLTWKENLGARDLTDYYNNADN